VGLRIERLSPAPCGGVQRLERGKLVRKWPGRKKGPTRPRRKSFVTWSESTVPTKGGKIGGPKLAKRAFSATGQSLRKKKKKT